MPAPPLTYILDGHNVLYAMRQAFLEQLAEGHPGTAAREELIQRLARAFIPPGPEVFLYFDGSAPGTESPSEQLRVIYPGGEGDQRADTAILEHVNEHLQAGKEAQLVVVTRDIKLARRARKRGASVLEPAEFFEAWKLGA
ncbi:MAG TPA: NYN domain-containing protein [Gammaproteobacteria bacterium]|nr:NYN domain-containing protein [Gammaproteobacteria bacterium]